MSVAAPAPILQVRGLTRRFGSFVAVDQLSFEVQPGEVFGFLGPNGAGKSTAINMMVGLLDPTAGEVLIEGRSLRRQRAALLGRLGFCPQETNLWDKLTCLEQLEFAGVNYHLTRAEARQRGAELLAALGLAQRANSLAGRLSGGMKRRLNLALALVHDPQLLFLDEPEAGLDPQSRVLVREYIRQLARRKTVVLTTHDMDEADRLADRIAIIDHGRLLVIDTPQALKQRLGGGLLEIEVRWPGGEPPGARAALLAQLQAELGAPGELGWKEDLLSVRAPAVTACLPRILALLQAAGLALGNLSTRAVTLEDVFLSLTGRGLRE